MTVLKENISLSKILDPFTPCLIIIANASVIFIKITLSLIDYMLVFAKFTACFLTPKFFMPGGNFWRQFCFCE